MLCKYGALIKESGAVVAGLNLKFAGCQLARIAKGFKVAGETGDERLVADEDASFNVFGASGFGEVGGGDYGNAAINNHALCVEAGPFLAGIREGARVMV